MILIGITGKATSGKDTAGIHIKNVMNAKRYAFADPLKRAASEMFGIPLSDFYNKKEVVNEFWDMTPRHILQQLGTEGGRELFRQDIWTKRAELEYQKAVKAHDIDAFVITDCRFENEGQLIRDLGGTLFHIFREVGAVEAHKSEDGIEFAEGDVAIDNKGSIQGLYKRLDIQLKKLVVPAQ